MSSARKAFSSGVGLCGELAVAPHGEQIEMDADEALGVAMAQHRGDERAPVAALRAEALVAEHVVISSAKSSAISSTPKRGWPGLKDSV